MFTVFFSEVASPFSQETFMINHWIVGFPTCSVPNSNRLKYLVVFPYPIMYLCNMIKFTVVIILLLFIRPSLFSLGHDFRQ